MMDSFFGHKINDPVISSPKTKLPMKNDLYNFFKNIIPFNSLEESDLQELLEESRTVSYQAGESIHVHNQSTVEHLSVIYKGTVEKYFLNHQGKKEFQECFARGDCFGEITILLNRKYAIRNALALEDTILHQIPALIFLEYTRKNPVFHDFFTSKFGHRLLDERYAYYLKERIAEASSPYETTDIFQKTLRQLGSRRIQTCPENTSIQEAAIKMQALKVGYLVISNTPGDLQGIITDHDFKTKVVAQGLDVNTPVREIMSQPILSISENAKMYEALLRMFQKDIRYLLVKGDEQYKGIVTKNQLLFHQSQSPFLFIQSINQARQKQELINLWQKVPNIIKDLFERGTRAETANEIVTSVIDTITRNVVERAVFHLHKLPIRFVFISMGSQGRQEQTLKTDQDNAIIFEEVSQEKAVEVYRYFQELGSLISDELHEIGFTYCEGNYMAKNPEWVQPLSRWKIYYDLWSSQADGNSLLNASIFSDARAIYGDEDLLRELKNYAFSLLDDNNRAFFAFLTKGVLETKPPLTFFRNFQLEKKDDRKNVLNIKKAMQIVTDFARTYTIKHKIFVTNTGDRLEALYEQGILKLSEYNELRQAYYYMMQFRLKNQVYQMNVEQREPDNFLDPKHITQVERVALKEVFKILKKFQTKMSIEFTGSLNG